LTPHPSEKRRVQGSPSAGRGQEIRPGQRERAVEAAPVHLEGGRIRWLDVCHPSVKRGTEKKYERLRERKHLRRVTPGSETGITHLAEGHAGKTLSRTKSNVVFRNGVTENCMEGVGTRKRFRPRTD